MKKLISLFLSVLMCLGVCSSFTACFGPGSTDDGTKTVIEYACDDGGFGRAWIDNWGKAFEEYAKDMEFAEGKKGVKFNVTQSAVPNINSQATSSYDIYPVYCGDTALQDTVRAGHAACIDDIMYEKYDNRDGEMLSIDDKIPASAKPNFKSDPDEAGVRKYYGIPLYSYSPGVTIDENCFNKFGFYFANDKDAAVPFFSPLNQETYYFVEPSGNTQIEAENKSAGPDQEFGTQDDGMPATMREFITMCEYIKENQITPFVAMGSAYQTAISFIYQGLLSSLLGYEASRALFDFRGKMEIVVGYYDEPLFPGLSPEVGRMLKPKTMIVDITNETGYYTTWASANYYADCFAELVYKMDWVYDKTYLDTYDQKTAMQDFILSGYDPNVKPVAMYCDCTFWHNEAKIGGSPQLFDAMINHDGHEPRHLKWLSLPTLFDGSEEYAADRTHQTHQQVMAYSLMIASRTEKENDGTFEACKEFFKFVCSDEQLNAFTKEVGLKLNLDYEITEETIDSLNYYFQQLAILYETKLDSVVEFSDSPAYLVKPERSELGYWGTRIGSYCWYTDEKEQNGKWQYESFIHRYFKNYRGKKSCSGMAAFEGSLLYKDDWKNASGIFDEQGNSVTKYIVDENGNNVLFENRQYPLVQNRIQH